MWTSFSSFFREVDVICSEATFALEQSVRGVITFGNYSLGMKLKKIVKGIIVKDMNEIQNNR